MVERKKESVKIHVTDIWCLADGMIIIIEQIEDTFKHFQSNNQLFMRLHVVGLKYLLRQNDLLWEFIV